MATLSLLQMMRLEAECRSYLKSPVCDPSSISFDQDTACGLVCLPELTLGEIEADVTAALNRCDYREEMLSAQ